MRPSSLFLAALATASSLTIAPAHADPLSIAAIQGTGDTSPMVGSTVTTQGVVTATYPSGGFRGFYLQTPGPDQTPGASDAVFVFGSALSAVAIGDHVEVTGKVSEYNGLTELTANSADAVVRLDPVGVATPRVITDWSSLDEPAEKESHEGELVEVRTPFTVADTYAANRYGSLTLAAGRRPLIQPTDAADALDAAAIAQVTADNAARGITLDDGASLDFSSKANTATPLPYVSTEHPVRVGAAVRFTAPLVLDQRFGGWNLQPTTQVTGATASPVEFTDTRTAAPDDVGGDLRLGTFNVLNYFPTTGADIVAAGGSCTYYRDRTGEPVTVDDCGDYGPRGAADAADLARQQAKIVAAINALGADIVSLEEIENSSVLGAHTPGDLGLDRDHGVATLVSALNAAAGADTWAYVPSPSADALPPLAEQDVIRTAFIYRPASVRPVGASQVLVGSSAFANARQPLAQAFASAGAPDRDAFAVIVNHFKSKGSGVDDGTGQGRATPTPIGSPRPTRSSTSPPASASTCAATCTRAAPSCWPVTSTPTPTRTRCRSSRTPVTPTCPRRRPASRPTSTAASRARWTTCSPTERRCAW